MKIYIQLAISFTLFFPCIANSQEEYSASPEAEAFFNSAMEQINQRHVNWIKTTAKEANEKSLSPDDVVVRVNRYGVLGSMNGQDIEAIAFLVLMQASKSAQEDLKAIMAKVKAINDKKQQLRDANAQMTNSRQNFTRVQLDSFKLLSNSCLVLKNQVNLNTHQPVRVTTLDSSKTVKSNNMRTTPSRSEINETKDRLKKDLDSMSEMGEMESLKLQMAMDRMSKVMSTLSNLLKKFSDTADSIVQNLK
ncbi:MAG: hypothetical protein HZB42_10575 [Sphingobacteriales bacterium]|nr:hypothetical protein [Sphingobacteriales bacterium]